VQKGHNQTKNVGGMARKRERIEAESHTTCNIIESPGSGNVSSTKPVVEDHYYRYLAASLIVIR